MGDRRPDLEGLDDVAGRALGDEERVSPEPQLSSRPGPAPERATSRLGPLVFEGMDALTDGLLSDPPAPSSAESSDTGLLETPSASYDDGESLSQILDIYDPVTGAAPSPHRLPVGGPVPREPASEASTEVTTAAGLELQSLVSLGPQSARPAPSAPVPVAPSRALDEAGLSRADIDEAVAAAEARRIEIAPRVVVVEDADAPRASVLLAAGGALLLGFLVFYLISAAPLPDPTPEAPATNAPR